MTQFHCRRTGRVYEIGEQLDHDGHAVVHAVGSGTSGLALKRYLPATLQRRPDLEARIKTMIAHPPAYRADPFGPVTCTWPEDAAYVSGQFAGFVMPRVDVRAAVAVHDLATRSATSWRDRVAVAENLTRAVAVLHDAGVVIGDFRTWNVLAWSDCHVTLLGCDLMQVVDPGSGRAFPCIAGRDACTPPELQLPASLSRTVRTSSSDSFTLALHLHLLLLQGAHPFRGRWCGPGDTPPEHVLAQEGVWSYGGGPRLVPHPGSPPSTVLTPTLQRYFRAAFVDGARDPGARPTARDWLAELVRLRTSLVTCPAEPTRACGSRAGHITGPAALPAHHDGAAPGTVGTRSARSARPPASRTRLLGLAPPHRRVALRLAACAAVAAVGIGGVVVASTGANPSAPSVVDPTVTAPPSSTAAVPPSPPDDPTAPGRPDGG